MYLTQRGGSAPGYFPTNTKWGSTSTLTGLLPGGDLRYFRPNFAMARGLYPGAQSSNLGQLAVDPTTLAIGVGALALGMFLLGSKKGPGIRKRRAARLRRRLAALEA
jgi:hypothetical protein